MRIGPISVTFNKKDISASIVSMSNQEITEKYEAGLSAGKKVILGTLSGRSGTRWLCDLFDQHANATGVTERYTQEEAFYRYINYNNLPIDTAGIILLIKKGIIEDWQKGDIALVFSPYFSHGIKKLIDELRPNKIIFAVSSPEFTVQSMYNKGLFEHDYIKEEGDGILGFQPEFIDSWSHYFGRVVPLGEAYQHWTQLTRLGKVAWFGNQMVVDIYNQLQHIDQEMLFIFHLQQASGNYEYYKKMATLFGLSPVLSEAQFFAIQKKWFKKEHNVRHEWSDLEKQEFKAQTKEWSEIYNSLSQK